MLTLFLSDKTYKNFGTCVNFVTMWTLNELTKKFANKS